MDRRMRDRAHGSHRSSTEVFLKNIIPYDRISESTVLDLSRGRAGGFRRRTGLSSAFAVNSGRIAGKQILRYLAEGTV